jgi:hypothetical protein
VPIFRRQLDTIQAALPDAVLDCVTDSENANALCGLFEYIYPYDRTRFAVETADAPLFDQLRRTGYDLAIATYQRDKSQAGYANVHEFLEAAQPTTLVGLTPTGRWLPTDRLIPASP